MKSNKLNEPKNQYTFPDGTTVDFGNRDPQEVLDAYVAYKNKIPPKGFEEYEEMRKAPKLTAEAVIAFINQLSPWNLKTTGLSILDTYASQQAQAAVEKALVQVDPYIDPKFRELFEQFVASQDALREGKHE